ncbi:velvet factor [Phlyctochytrium arcticum]|nr:velvet factor [Phlyctochytrium arcticum]
MQQWESDYTYELNIVQQPARARMCGFARALERRLVDPPPILELILRKNGAVVGVDHELGTSLICHATLRAEDGITDRALVVRSLNANDEGRFDSAGRNDRPTSFDYGAASPNAEEVVYKTLVGSAIVPCSFLKHLDGHSGMYFVFYDLNVRTRGTYRLHFAVMSLKGYPPVSMARAVVLSDPFEVYTPAFFPGTMESTELSRCFARQGVPIHLRQDYSAIRSQPFLKTTPSTSTPSTKREDGDSPLDSAPGPSSASSK